MGRYPSGQRGQTVNLLAYAYAGSNPALPTTFLGEEVQTAQPVTAAAVCQPVLPTDRQLRTWRDHLARAAIEHTTTTAKLMSGMRALDAAKTNRWSGGSRRHHNGRAHHGWNHRHGDRHGTTKGSLAQGFFFGGGTANATTAVPKQTATMRGTNCVLNFIGSDDFQIRIDGFTHAAIQLYSHIAATLHPILRSVVQKPPVAAT